MTIKYLRTQVALAKRMINRRTFETGVSEAAVSKLQRRGLLVWTEVNGSRMIDVEATIEKSGIMIDLSEPELACNQPPRPSPYDLEAETRAEQILVNTLIGSVRDFSLEGTLEVMKESIQDHYREIETGISREEFYADDD